MGRCETVNEKRRGIWKTVVLAVLFMSAQVLLKEDGKVFAVWWLTILVLGWCSFPLCQYLFSGFRDRGYLVAKIFGIAGAGFLMWLGASTGIVPFTHVGCLVSTGVLAAVCWGVWIALKKQKIKDKTSWKFTTEWYQTVLDDELVFIVFFLLWTYVAGFRPAAYGTEKFMDYGFMMAMMRSTTLPAKDLWYAGAKINYYYGGQYFAVFLTKLTNTQVAQTYNLMRTLVAGFCFAVPFGLVRQMVLDSWKREKPALLGGALAGAGVSLAGNMHYVVIGKLLPWIREIFHLQKEDYTYWFPNSTRYIGYYPAGNDKTIHEFPSYSFVLGDLHAHVVNLMFVVALISLVYAMMKHHSSKGALQAEAAGEKNFCKKQVAAALTDPYVLVFAFLIGMFHWTNYWDFVIYYTVTCGVILIMNIIGQEGKVKWILAVTAAQAAEILILATLIILPFTMQFDSSNMVQGIALAQHHSLPHQLLVLWGLPTILTVLFIISLLVEKLKVAENRSLYRLLKAVTLPDLFAVIMGLCAIGLVLIPELVYVRDIYESGNARANTMFKLTYQAYIMFGLTMIYAIFRLLIIGKNKILKALALIGLILFVWTCGYFGNSVHAWFGKVWKPSEYKGLNATAFLETDFSEDVGGIKWLKENVKDVEVVLEANGDSYSEYERVSAMTGLPTIMGWYVHEWLWRGDLADINAKIADVENIYTSTDEAHVKSLLEEYDISYIFVGSCERKKYGAQLNNDMLKSMGEVVYQDDEWQTYIVKVK